MTIAWPTNLPRSLDYPDVGMDALLAGAARAYPDRVAVRDGEARLTFAELNDHARRVASGLRRRGIEAGDAVALHMPNSIWFIVAYYGTLCAGAAAAAINPAQPVDALRTQLEDCKARAVITHPATVSVLDAAMPATVEFAVCIPASIAAPGPAVEEVPTQFVRFAELLQSEPLDGYRVDPELVAHLQLTGGTTGRSKAVRVLHRNLVSNVVQIACWRTGSVPVRDADGGVRLEPIPGASTAHSLVPGEVNELCVAPLFHGLGLVGYNLGTLLGATAIMAGRFDPDAMLRDIERYRVTELVGSPAMYYALLRTPSLGAYDLSSVRLITSGAAPIDTTALQRLRAAFPSAHVAEGYGLTEATMGLTGAPVSSGVPIPPGSVGVPLFDTAIEIRSSDRTSVLLQGEIGEVWATGPQITDGYQDEAARTAEQFVDGWLCTGDLGRVDENGFLFLVGRAKDMLIYKGYNVYPQPLEEILCSHPDVAQASVVGMPSGDVGEIPVAFVVLRPGADNHAALPEELMAFVAPRVAPYQRVRAVRVLDALPLTPTGKVLKTELRARLHVKASA